FGLVPVRFAHPPLGDAGGISRK
ncbi:MAG: hypothetical protein QOI53_3383, partial [Verrucomicrobiota bacterium]|nr:hypothetical protein [Verrucomicrobiota bacterium]